MAIDTECRKLMPEEIVAYNERGYVVVPDVFPLEELGEIDREIDRIQETQKDLGRNAGWVMQLGLRTDVTRQFAEDERALAGFRCRIQMKRMDVCGWCREAIRGVLLNMDLMVGSVPGVWGRQI